MGGVLIVEGRAVVLPHSPIAMSHGHDGEHRPGQQFRNVRFGDLVNMRHTGDEQLNRVVLLLQQTDHMLGRHTGLKHDNAGY